MLLAVFILSGCAAENGFVYRPDKAYSYANSGYTNSVEGNYEQALADYSKAIELNPYPPYYQGRGSVYYRKKQYDSAIKEYIKAIRLDNNYAPAYHSLAWLLATCSDEKYRDGLRAVELAKKAVDLVPAPNWYSILYNTLAAAYAEAGDFDMAVKSQEKAIQFLSDKGKSDHLDGFEKRLESYKRDIPWRDM